MPAKPVVNLLPALSFPVSVAAAQSTLHDASHLTPLRRRKEYPSA